jgi:predicted nucleotidyltransferase
MLVKNNDQMQTILRVLVGSQAHGLATAESDRDYRRVYVMPTEQMFHLGFKYPATQWTKTEGDETAWEIGQFLTLSLPIPCDMVSRPSL